MKIEKPRIPSYLEEQTEFHKMVEEEPYLPKNDTYQISMEISGGGNCSVNLNSNNRAQISYSGTVSPVKDETGKS